MTGLGCDSQHDKEDNDVTALTAGMLDAVRAGADAHALAQQVLQAALDDGDFTRSVGNCHTGGVDSIVLYDHTAEGGGMLRYFWANRGKHRLRQLYNRAGHYTLGVHNHRYPLALIPLVGTIGNVRVTLSDRETPVAIHEYEFASALADDDVQQIRTVHRARRWLADQDIIRIAPGDAETMDSADLHTVWVADDHPAGTGWLVIEGPDAGRSPLIYSPRDDLTVSSDDLYVPMTEDRARNLTEHVLTVMGTG